MLAARSRSPLSLMVTAFMLTRQVSSTGLIVVSETKLRGLSAYRSWLKAAHRKSQMILSILVFLSAYFDFPDVGLDALRVAIS